MSCEGVRRLTEGNVDRRESRTSCFNSDQVFFSVPVPVSVEDGLSISMRWGLLSVSIVATLRGGGLGLALTVDGSDLELDEEFGVAVCLFVNH